MDVREGPYRIDDPDTTTTYYESSTPWRCQLAQIVASPNDFGYSPRAVFAGANSLDSIWYDSFTRNPVIKCISNPQNPLPFPHERFAFIHWRNLHSIAKLLFGIRPFGLRRGSGVVHQYDAKVNFLSHLPSRFRISQFRCNLVNSLNDTRKYSRGVCKFVREQEIKEVLISDCERKRTKGRIVQCVKIA